MTPAAKPPFSVLFVSGTVGDTRRYRCLHPREQLEQQGIPVGFREATDVGLLDDAFAYDVFILHRVPYSDLIGRLLELVHRRGKVALFETDDLVFEPDLIEFDGYYRSLAPAKAEQYRGNVHLQLKTLRHCDVVLTTTEFLAQRLERRGKRAFVHRNALSTALVRISEEASLGRPTGEEGATSANGGPERGRARGEVVIGYFSGTPTHDRDFAIVAPALLHLMDKHPEIRLHVVGHLAIDAEFARFGSRVERIPYMAWQELPYAIAQVDINLAPLEVDNPFCQCKSELKYFEAGILGVPSVASRTEAFEFAIQHGENGLLAGSTDEWTACLELLISDADCRSAMGNTARCHVRQNYAPEPRGRQLVALLSNVVAAHGSGRDAAPAMGPAERRTTTYLDEVTPPLRRERRRPLARLVGSGKHLAKRLTGRVYRMETEGGPCQLIDEVVAGQVYGQTFYATEPNLHAIDVLFATFGRVNTPAVILHLKESPATEEDLATATISASTLFDNPYHSFSFDPLPDSAGRRYYCCLESPEAVRGDAVGLWSYVDAPAGSGTMYRDGQPVAGRLVHVPRYAPQPSRVSCSPSPARPDGERWPRVYFVSGCKVGTTYEYRVLHKQEQLACYGLASAAQQDIVYNEARFREILSYDILYLYRITYSAPLEELIRQARARDIPVVFDTDDLVFEPDLVRYVDSLGAMSDDRAAEHYEGVWRYQQAVLAADYVVTSTEYLAGLARKYGKPTFVHRNALSGAWIEAARDLYVQRRTRPSRSDRVVIGYSSGTATHSRDFLEASAALAQVLAKHPEVELHILGPLVVPAELQPFGERVRNLPLVHWTKVPHIVDTFDINLGPLERDNPFCRSKSEVKYMEAAALGIPTIASRIDAFESAIRDGENGFLAGDSAEWAEKLERLIGDPELRLRMGEDARTDVLARYAPPVRGRELIRTLATIQELHAQRTVQAPRAATPDERRKPLVLNWIFTEWPPASGGHTNIVRMMNLLASFGHQINTYVLPFTWLCQRSDLEIREFVRRDFADIDGCVIKWASGRVQPADATIVTYWETAYLVGNAAETSRILYFVQDWEPFFYPMGVQYLRAEQTYKMGFSCITLGRWLTERLRSEYGADADYFDLAADHTIYYPRETPKTARPRICFYARPSTPRRLFPIGIEALRLAHQRCPDAEIVFYGSSDADLCAHPIPFPYANRGVLSERELAELFSSSHIGVVLSPTNCSLVPREMMACRCAIVDLDRETVGGVLRHEGNALLAEPTPEAIADAVVRLVQDEPLRRRLAETAHRESRLYSWEKSARQVERIIYERVPPARRLANRSRAPVLPGLPALGDLPQEQQERLDAIHWQRKRPGRRRWTKIRTWVKGALRVDEGTLLNMKPVQIVGELAGRRMIGQRFVARYDRLCRIDVLVATYGRRNTRDLVMHLRDSLTATEDVAMARVNASLLEDNQYARFVFEPQPESRGRPFWFWLEAAEAVPGDAVTLWAYSQVEMPELRMRDGRRAGQGQLIFGTFYLDDDLGEIGERPLVWGWERVSTRWDRVQKAYRLLAARDLRGLWREIRAYGLWLKRVGLE